MEIERSPRENRYTTLGNELLQDHSLSLTARGLAAYILSLPSGARVDIKGLAKRVPEGQARIASALRELKTAGYVHQTKERGERGRIYTRTVMYDTPMPPAPDLDSPGLGAPDLGNTRSGATRENTAKDQVAPDLAKPGPGNARRKTLKEPLQEDLPPTKQPPMPEKPAQDPGGMEGDQEDQNRKTARDLVNSLPPVAGRRPGRGLRAELIVMVAGHLACGWKPQDLIEEMTRDLGSARHAGVYRSRLLDIVPVPPQKGTPATGAVARHHYQPGGLMGSCAQCARPMDSQAHYDLKPASTSRTRCPHGRAVAEWCRECQKAA